MGLAFKPDTDDMRDAPSRVIVNELAKEGAILRVYDPIAMENAQSIFTEGSITFTKNSYEAVDGADLLILVTEWNEFKELDMKKVKGLMKSPNIIDGRNIP